MRQAILDSGKSLCTIERETGIARSALSRFLKGERGVSMSVMDSLGEYLGLRITIDATKAKKGGGE
ncbi:MAG TPA: hypothetical protein DD670_07640 [Planctomycetaceae bacterium]|nr:hypothetical protein [Planctomycetaceae bacterium]